MKTRARLAFFCFLGAFACAAISLPRKLTARALRAFDPPQLCVEESKPHVCQIAVNMPDPGSQTSLDTFAVQLLDRLTSTSGPPEWESWDTKGSLGLLPDNLKRLSKASQDQFMDNPDWSAPTHNTVFSFEVPVQNRVVKNSRSHSSVADHELDSVFYNSIARDGIVAQRNKVTTKLMPLDVGAMIVKTVWELLPDKNSHQRQKANGPGESGVPIDLTRLTPESERSWKTKSGLMYSSAFSRVAYGPGPGACSSSDADVKVVPTNCAHAIAGIKTADPGNVYPWQQECQNGCTAVLAGLNIMIRTAPGGEWVWITAWLSGHNSNPLRDNPWRNYYVSASNQERSVTRTTAKNEVVPNYIFDPYLEGAKDPNGQVSNCKNCHSYAAYNSQTLAPLDGLGPNYGSPDPMSPDNLGPPACPEAGCPYLNSAVRTDFMWSLANVGKVFSKIPPQPHE